MPDRRSRDLDGSSLSVHLQSLESSNLYPIFRSTYWASKILLCKYVIWASSTSRPGRQQSWEAQQINQRHHVVTYTHTLVSFPVFLAIFQPKGGKVRRVSSLDGAPTILEALCDRSPRSPSSTGLVKPHILLDYIDDGV